MVKNKNQSQSRSRSSSGQAQRLGIFGASGTGKTYKARSLVKDLRRIVFVDPLGDFSNTAGAIIINGDLEAVKEAIIKNYCLGFKIVFIPVFGSVERQLSDLCYFLVTMQSGYLKGYHTAQITLLVDELDEGFPSGVMMRNPKNGFGYLCKRGRHYGINLVGVSQRTAQVDVCFRGNLSAVYLFRHADPIDTQKAVDLLGREYKDRFLKLNNFHYFYKSGQIIVEK